MVVIIDERLISEVARYHLVFACPDCVQFDEERARCTLGYPTEPHVNPKLDGRTHLTFCKTFELW